MKIISKFKDYYDATQSLGIDEKLIYKRFQELKEFDYPKGYDNFIKDSNDRIELDKINLENSIDFDQECVECEHLIIGFCGNIYPAFKFSHKKNNQIKNIKTLYDSGSILKFLNILKDKYKKIYFRDYLYGYHHQEPDKKVLDIFFNQKIFVKTYNSWFQYFQSPIFVIEENGNRIKLKYKEPKTGVKLYVTLNPKLKDLEFYRIKDSYSAFQEISQFLGGVLTKREMIEDKLTDKEKINQHGFDPKYGFRKRKKD